MRLRLLPKHIFGLKLVIHLSALLPLVFTFYQAISDQLGADPVEDLLHFTGISAFNLLLISLMVSPLAKTFKTAALIRVRRVLGLYAFAYALIHFLVYIFFELQLEWQLLISEIIKRPYITVGFVALLILSVMAITSTKKSQIKLGRKWQSLHNLVYLSAILIALHYIWSVKSDMVQPIIYWIALFILLYFRLNKIKSIFIKKRLA